MALPPITGVSHPLPSQSLPGKIATTRTPAEPQLNVLSQPMLLLYRSAIEKLNEYFEAELGTDAIQQAAESGEDYSPEAVAERILSFATAGFAGYQERHPEQAGDEQLSEFMALIRGAIEKGFEEARGILDGLGVLQGDIKTNADRTYELIQEGLDRFEEQQREPAEGE